MSTPFVMTAGRAAPLGATFDGDGVNFAVFSEHAQRMVLCLFSEDGKHEIERLDLPERDGDVWHGFVSGMRPGQQYGLRAHGPFAPQEGHRFNPNKLLIDPYAKRLTGHPIWDDALMGYTVGADDADLSFDKRDSAPFMPRSVVEDPSFSWGRDKPPLTPVTESVVYEAHVKGLTALHPGVELPGTFLGMASDPMLDYLTDLGITAIELLPAQAFLNDRFLVEKKLTNYWGYQTLGFFAPEPRYLHRAQISEFQQMVARFHSAGIEVLMDVVYNHTCEGNEMGPTLAFRGLDNLSYYRLAEDARFYHNDTGTGNTVNVDHPMVLRMVMDSLRYWVEVMHVDGFRFDLCSTLGRTDQGFDRGAAFFDAIRQDPVLSGVKLIAEPWDIGPGGYQLGAFPPPFMEWNDKYRDTVRRFWRLDPGMAPGLADRLTGSALQFDHSGRPATSSVNLITAHDGFTLQDVVSYNEKHNEANGEDGNDGHGENYSDNMGAEGPTEEASILSARAQRRRNLMATLFLSQGTPMLLAGDEMGHSQQGNNNAYCQDSAISWIDWSRAEPDFHAFTRRLIAFRRDRAILRQKLFLHSHERAIDGKVDLFWTTADGTPISESGWEDPALDCICAEMRTASGSPSYGETETAVFAVYNSGEGREAVLPEPPEGSAWVLEIDTADPDAAPRTLTGTALEVGAHSVVALVLEPLE
ncbi:glycogen debranching protein GlgX [Oceaniovalibus sp. ACAM 378]|uniref:glycogen debranching protein GlgX n=1 Tax=Oceaniovalibus sp. ACAM 378 TaxID=2599923 RepID=UPI0011DAC3C4|nr:glycogen debranching protein GlgX [Oceaniovalibus sp. ACAM 378]TYB91101.1 glycogen debranching protein GlgX [Oceaniovalibus sp. ACAM 378]